MHYHDPSRPKGLSGRLQYLAPNGRPVAALPRLGVEPLPEGGWSISCELMVGHVTARQFVGRTQLPIDEVLANWAKNPEEFMRLFFEYVPTHLDQPTTPEPKAKVSLADLDL